MTAPSGMPGTTGTTSRPRPPAGLVLHPPIAADRRWVAELPDGGFARLGPDAARLVQAADGRHDAAGLARALGEPWTAAAVRRAVGDLAALGIVVDGAPDTDAPDPGRPESGRRTAGRRLTVKPPCSVQLDVVRPGDWFARHQRACRRLTGRVAAAVMLALGIAGLVALAARAGTLAVVLSTPQPPAVVVAVVAGFVALTSVHELAHAAALAGLGGRVRRMGVMLLYLTPAFFTDVSDGWRLPRPADRVRVALAGGVASVGLAGGLGLLVAGGWVGDGPVPAYLAVTTYAGSLLNLVPLVKFDGYLALMNHLDRPHLRRNALHDGRRAVAGLVAGPRALRGGPALPDLRWAVAYGLACALMPVVLVGSVALTVAGALAGLGVVGAGLRLALSAGLAALVVLGGRRVAALVDGAAVRPARLALGLAAVVLGLAALGAVALPDTIMGGYVRGEDGAVRLVLPAAGDADRLPPGRPVQLRSRGLLLSRSVGTATVAADPPRVDRVPAGAVTPGIETPGSVAAATVALDHVVAAPGQPPVGEAEVEAGTTTVAGWLGRELLTEPWRDLWRTRP